MKKLKWHLSICTFFLSSLFYSFTVYADTISKDHEIIKQEQQIIQININHATAEELAKGLNGIGLSKAKKIIEYRDKFGAFISIEQLKEVSGIGQSILDKNVGKITL